MKKTKRARSVLALIILSLLITSCGQSDGDLKGQITTKIGKKATTLGDLQKNGIQVSIPAGALAKENTFSLQAADKSPDADSGAGSLLRTPYDINIVGDVKRFNRPVEITFKLTDKQWNSFDNPKDIHVGYFDGNQWVYLVPSQFDLKNHTLTYQTYHCSFLSPAEPTEEEMKKQIAHSMAVESTAFNKNAELKKTTESLVKSVMGPNVDKSLLRDIVEGILDQNDYTQLAKAAANGNKEEIETQFIASYTTVVANTLWTYAADHADNLGDMGANLGLIGAFGSSTSHIANGNYKAAAEELAKGIIQTNPVGKFYMTAVNVTERQIARWKSEEIEAAYQIFLKGKEPTIPFWGYGSIPAGDFNEIWNQMRGVGRQIVIDAVEDFKAENGREPTDEERANIEADAKNTLETEFNDRKQKEKAIAEAEKKNLEFLKILESGNLLTKYRYGYNPSKMTYKGRVRQLIELRNKVLVDTNRVMNFGGDDTDKEINVYTVSQLISVYVGEGEDAYQKLLIEKGLIEVFDMKKATGTYTAPLQFSRSSISKTERPQKQLTISGNASIGGSDVKVTVKADGKVSVSYEVQVQAHQENIAKYPSGFVSNTNANGTYKIEEAFKDIAIKTMPGSVTRLDDINGDRYYSGTEDHNDANERHFDIERTYVSGSLENLTTRISGSQLVISGKTVIEMPDASVGNLAYGTSGFQATFEIVINAKK